MKILRNKLKHTEPYYIRDFILPKLFFKEDENDTEYWIFYYSFINRLSDINIGVRLGYDAATIYRKSLEIIRNNYSIIKEHLQ